MKVLEDRIRKDGLVYPGHILKVDSFLNHQIDIEFMDQLAMAFYDRYKDAGITKIVTIESSGIAVASSTARVFKVPMIFAKKSQSLNIGGDVYSTEVYSYTYKKVNKIIVSKKYLGEEDTVLIVDDFLATGNAMKGLCELCNKAGAKIAGIGFCIEKGFQSGRKELEELGYEVMSLAIIESMTDDGQITFRSDEL